jgi:Domain of unknown function (DUF4282)
MQVEGFFASLFDFSFRTFITERIIKVLYVLSTIIVALWTLFFVLVAFRNSTGFGVVTLVLLGPLFFVFTMIYVRVVLELIMVIFRIHEDVDSINRRGGGAASAAVPFEPAPAAPEPAPEPASPEPVAAADPEPAATTEETPRFCDSCGAERSPGKSFCTSCGKAFA